MELNPSITELIYLASNDQDVMFDGKTWRAFPFKITQVSDKGDGNLSSIQIAVANQTGEISALVVKNRGFGGQKATLILVVRDSGGTVSEAFRQTFTVRKSQVRDNAAVFEMNRQDIMSLPFPSQLFFRDRCRFFYKGGLCGYTGALVTCDRTLRGPNGCDAHSNTTQHGGFPGIIRR